MPRLSRIQSLRETILVENQNLTQLWLALQQRDLEQRREIPVDGPGTRITTHRLGKGRVLLMIGADPEY